MRYSQAQAWARSVPREGAPPRLKVCQNVNTGPGPTMNRKPASPMRARKLWWIPAILVLAIVAYAWVDGGREPVHEIAVPIQAPGESR